MMVCCTQVSVVSRMTGLWAGHLRHCGSSPSKSGRGMKLTTGTSQFQVKNKWCYTSTPHPLYSTSWHAQEQLNACTCVQCRSQSTHVHTCVGVYGIKASACLGPPPSPQTHTHTHTYMCAHSCVWYNSPCLFTMHIVSQKLIISTEKCKYKNY